jgi:hypothetical protein
MSLSKRMAHPLKSTTTETRFQVCGGQESFVQ